MRSILYCWPLLAALLLGSATPVCAQQAPMQFGKVQAQDFTASPADSGAAAVMLCDLGRSRIEGGTDGFQLVYVRTTRIRILRKAGYKWATVDVPLYHHNDKEERLSAVQGATYNLVNGRLVQDKLTPQALFKEKVDASHVRHRFTLPNVREGSIIEFTYTIHSDFLFNLQGWQFQHDIPVRWSEYQTVIPRYFRYKQITRGYLRANPHEEKVEPYSTRVTWRNEGIAPPQELMLGTDAVHERWVMQNVPAFREEPFMTTAHDYVASLTFELNSIQYPGQDEQNISGTWEKINEQLRRSEFFGGLLKRGPLAEEARRLAAQHPADTLARVRAVLALVQRTVRPNHEPGVYADRNSLRLVADQHQGNVAEINLLLVQTLREAGLQANPVLLSTRAHGQILRDLPLLSQFDYVVAQVALPGQPNALLDATEPLSPLGLLPAQCLNGQGRLIADKAEQGRWVALTPGRRYGQYTSAKLTLNERGALQGTAHFEQVGYAGLEHRDELRTSTAQAYVGRLQQQHPEWSISQPTFQHLTEPEEPLVLEVALQLAGADQPVSLIYLDLLRQFMDRTNPFEHAERQYPVSFGMAREQTTVLTVLLPPGFVLQEPPAALALALPNGGGRFLYQVSQPTPQSVQLTARLQLLKPEYSPAEYAGLRELYQRALAKSAEVLVLRRQ